MINSMVGFTGYPLDRADHLRTDAEALKNMAHDRQARFLRLTGMLPEIAGKGALVWDGIDTLPTDGDPIFLGLADSIPHFVALPTDSAVAPSYRTPQLMAALALLDAPQAAIYGTARALLDWHGRHRFCGRCGGKTDYARGGWGRHCPACKIDHFPRVDPVVIMLAEHDGRALIGRQASWPARRYSALAGFVEPGESVEEAVARELFEEAGVRATEVRYVASQPWPFPAQLMLACVAQVESDALKIATHEIEDAMWASQSEVRAALTGEPDARFLAPPPYAIAFTLLEHWSR